VKPARRAPDRLRAGRSLCLTGTESTAQWGAIHVHTWAGFYRRTPGLYAHRDSGFRRWHERTGRGRLCLGIFETDRVAQAGNNHRVRIVRRRDPRARQAKVAFWRRLSATPCYQGQYQKERRRRGRRSNRVRVSAGLGRSEPSTQTAATSAIRRINLTISIPPAAASGMSTMRPAPDRQGGVNQIHSSTRGPSGSGPVLDFWQTNYNPRSVDAQLTGIDLRG